jgi:hypothetical protein
MSQIRYCKGYKYQLRDPYTCPVKIFPEKNIVTELVRLDADGLLTIRKYFAWDGCTFPAIDTKTNMRGGLIHDALYYLLRTGMLNQEWRMRADQELYLAMLQDGALPFRAEYYRWAVNTFGDHAAKDARKILIAP